MFLMLVCFASMHRTIWHLLRTRQRYGVWQPMEILRLYGSPQGIRILITLNSDVVAKGKDENGAWILSFSIF